MNLKLSICMTKTTESFSLLAWKPKEYFESEKVLIFNAQYCSLSVKSFQKFCRFIIDYKEATNFYNAHYCKVGPNFGMNLVEFVYLN